MSPQFADFNADGRLDIVAGTFDGSPHVALGTEQGYAAPEHILDAKGERILLNSFWNFTTKKWDATQRCDATGDVTPEGQCTSAVAFDWDADGDPDLLLGDYRTGRLYRRMNEGKAGAPRFASVNLPVLVGKEPLKVDGKLSTPRLFDWDRDGLVDLVCGTFGDLHGSEQGGAVLLFRNVGKPGAPAFAKAQTLIAPGGKGAKTASRPDAGLYPDVGDVDGDGDWDLIVGGAAYWTPEARTLTAEESARAKALRAEIKGFDDEMGKMYEKLAAETKGLADDVAEAKRAEWHEKNGGLISNLHTKRESKAEELDRLEPGPKNVYSVWLYLNEGDA
jgi:hypothetical protein